MASLGELRKWSEWSDPPGCEGEADDASVVVHDNGDVSLDGETVFTSPRQSWGRWLATEGLLPGVKVLRPNCKGWAEEVVDSEVMQSMRGALSRFLGTLWTKARKLGVEPMTQFDNRFLVERLLVLDALTRLYHEAGRLSKLTGLQVLVTSTATTDAHYACEELSSLRASMERMLEGAGHAD
jgi:hypothetical protein